MTFGLSRFVYKISLQCHLWNHKGFWPTLKTKINKNLNNIISLLCDVEKHTKGLCPCFIWFLLWNPKCNYKYKYKCRSRCKYMWHPTWLITMLKYAKIDVRKTIFFFTHQSLSGSIITMGITKRAKMWNSCFKLKYPFNWAHILPICREGL